MKVLRRLSIPLAAIGLAAGLLVVTQTPASAATAPTRVVVQPIQKVQRYLLYINVTGQTQAEHPTAGWGQVPDTGTASLQRRLAGTTTWRTVQTDTTPGQFDFRVRAMQNASYRVVYSGSTYGEWVFPAATSVNRWLLVRRNLNDYLSRSGGFYIRGDINPGGGFYVFVERKTCSTCAYRAYKRVISGKAGKFSVRIGVPRRGTHYYRAYVKKNAKFTRSPSNKIYRTYRY